MASAADREDHAEQVPRGPGTRRSLSNKLAAAPAALLVLAVLAAGCGGPKLAKRRGRRRFLVAVGGSSRRTRAVCGSHRIADFPDPTTSPGGGIAFQINGGPGSDLNRNNPAFIAADKACRGLLPGAGQASAPLSAREDRRRGAVGSLHALPRPARLPGPEQPGRLRQQPVRRDVACVSNRQQRLQVPATDRADAGCAGQGLGDPDYVQSPGRAGSERRIPEAHARDRRPGRHRLRPRCLRWLRASVRRRRRGYARQLRGLSARTRNGRLPRSGTDLARRQRGNQDRNTGSQLAQGPSGGTRLQDAHSRWIQRTRHPTLGSRLSSWRSLAVCERTGSRTFPIRRLREVSPRQWDDSTEARPRSVRR